VDGANCVESERLNWRFFNWRRVELSRRHECSWRAGSHLQEDTMHKVTPLFAAAAVCAFCAALAGRAEAGALAGAEGVRAAIDGVNVVENVVCRPGVVHARTWPYDGCPRGVYRGKDDPFAVANGSRPHFYGWGPSGYRAGVGPSGYVAPYAGYGWVTLGADWGYPYGWAWNGPWGDPWSY
jgi:hypothetical protein